MMKNCVMGLRSKLANRKENNKGFTLVELIVVIVILAILAAILIPGLMKWIDEARDKQYQLEARSVYMAAEGVVAKNYGSTGDTGVNASHEITMDANALAEIKRLSGLEEVTLAKLTYDTNDAIIEKFETEFTSTNGKKVGMKLENGAWTKTKEVTP